MDIEPIRTDQPLVCVNCGRVSDGDTAGWRAYRHAPNIETGEAPEVLMFCPDCAEREFGT